MARRLLVIDDALMIREMIKDAAVAEGWEIAGEAANGQEAVHRYLEVHPDVATLDLVMPEYNGLYALEGIRRADPNAVVLVVSALEQTEVLKKAFKLGAADFLVKPFDKSHLVQALDVLVPRVPAAAGSQVLAAETLRSAQNDGAPTALSATETQGASSTAESRW